MKKILLLALMSTFAMSSFTYGPSVKNITASAEDKELCKVAIKNAHDYKTNMQSDMSDNGVADAYKKIVVAHCSTLVVKS